MLCLLHKKIINCLSSDVKRTFSTTKMSRSDDFLSYYLIDFENCINNEELNSLQIVNSELITNLNNWKPLIQADFDETKLKSFFQDLEEERRTQFFNFGIVCLTHFIQRNFTGPGFPQKIGEFLSSELVSNINFAKLLAVNNEEINVNTEFPELLVAAKAIFNCCHFDYTLNLWWTWRATYIHQHILDELSPSLLSQADRIEKELSKLPLTGECAIYEFFFFYIIFFLCRKYKSKTGN